jgi:hypothetical protein
MGMSENEILFVFISLCSAHVLENFAVEFTRDYTQE